MFTNTNHPPSQSPPEVTRIKNEIHTRHKLLVSFPFSSSLSRPSPYTSLTPSILSSCGRLSYSLPYASFSFQSLPNSSPNYSLSPPLSLPCIFVPPSLLSPFPSSFPSRFPSFSPPTRFPSLPLALKSEACPLGLETASDDRRSSRHCRRWKVVKE